MRWFFRRGIRDPEDRREAWIEVLAVLFVAVFPYYIFQYLPGHLLRVSIDDSLARVGSMMPVLAILGYILWKSDMALPHFGLGKNLDLTGGFIFVAALILNVAVMTVVGAALYALWPVDPEISRNLSAAFPKPHTIIEWGAFGLAILAGAATEEIAIRGILTIRLFDLLGSKLLAGLVPALLFMGYHYYQGTAAMICVGIIGVVTGFMQLSTKRLKALILAHALANVYLLALYH